MNILEAIPTLYPLLSSGKYKAEFEEISEARKFTVGLREQIMELGVPYDHIYKVIEERNSNVFIDAALGQKLLTEATAEVKEESCQIV